MHSLEVKQDLLEVENLTMMENLKKSESKNHGLAQELSALDSEISKLKLKNRDLEKLISVKESQIVEYKESMTEKENSAKIETDEKNLEVKIKELEIIQLNQQICQLKNSHAENLKKLEEIEKAAGDKISSIQVEQAELQQTIVNQNKILDDKLTREKILKDQAFAEKQKLEVRLEELEYQNYEEIITNMREELRKLKILLQDAKKQIARNIETPQNQKLVSKLQNRIDDIENDKNTVMRQKKYLEIELSELNDQIVELSATKEKLNKQYVDKEPVLKIDFYISRT